MKPEEVLKKIIDGTLYPPDPIVGVLKPCLAVGHTYYVMFYYKGVDKNDVTLVDVPHIIDLTLLGPKVSITGLKKFLSPKDRIETDDDFWMLFERTFIYEG